MEVINIQKDSWNYFSCAIIKYQIGIITYYIIFNLISVTNPTIVTNLMNSQKEAQLMDISEGYLITLGIILFILLIPEIEKGKNGTNGIWIKEQHIHPTNDSPSLSKTLTSHY